MSFGMIMQNRDTEKKVKLCYMNIDSFIVYIKTEEIYVIIKKIHKFIITTNPFIILKSATFRVNFTHYQAFISTI